MVRFRAGPAWTPGESVRDQPRWDDHADFVDALVARGTMVMGGPFADRSGSMILLEGLDEEEARRILASDPFIENGVFLLDEVKAWEVFVDALGPRAE